MMMWMLRRRSKMMMLRRSMLSRKTNPKTEKQVWQVAATSKTDLYC